MNFTRPAHPCGEKTGFARSGFCERDARDAGKHTVCATLTDDFLQFTRARGNGLRGLRSGDRWCICESRYEQAKRGGVAPPVHATASAYDFSNESGKKLGTES